MSNKLLMLCGLILFMGISINLFREPVYAAKPGDEAIAVDGVTPFVYGQPFEKLSDDLTSFFSPEWYAMAYPDVANDPYWGQDAKHLYQHFLDMGIYELRAPSGNLNIEAYASAYPDLREAFGTDVTKYYEHFLTKGIEEGRKVTNVQSAMDNYVDVYPLGKTAGENNKPLFSSGDYWNEIYESRKPIPVETPASAPLIPY